MKSAELLNLNLAIEADLQNFIYFLMESVKRLRGNAFMASLACMELNQLLRVAGACSGQPFPVSLQLQNQGLQVHWNKGAFELIKTAATEQHVIEQLRDYLRKSTDHIDPQILIQRNEAMVRHLHDTRMRTEHELADLEVKLRTRQAELQASIHQAETDPLTGLLNRRAFDAKLSQSFRYTMRQKNSPLSLIMLDLDFFKNINDQFGHQFGDSYLIKMAQILRSEIREDVDYAFRFGGDEFAMVIYADYATACSKAKHVLSKMDGKVSIGISAIDQHTPDNLTLEEFIYQADNALYDAKHRGRGQVVVAKCSRIDTQLCELTCPVKEACV